MSSPAAFALGIVLFRSLRQPGTEGQKKSAETRLTAKTPHREVSIHSLPEGRLNHMSQSPAHRVYVVSIRSLPGGRLNPFGGSSHTARLSALCCANLKILCPKQGRYSIFKVQIPEFIKVYTTREPPGFSSSSRVRVPIFTKLTDHFQNQWLSHCQTHEHESGQAQLIGTP